MLDPPRKISGNPGRRGMRRAAATLMDVGDLCALLAGEKR
jgi:hypothetical protein